MTRRTDNYTAMRDRMAARFLDFDQDRMVRQFSLAADADFLYLRFAARDHRIARRTGAVTWSADGFRTEAPADYNAAMTIYDVLSRAGTDCRLSGETVPLSQLAAVQGGSLSPGRDLFQAAADRFDRDPAALDRACRRMDGVPADRADVAYALPLFPFLAFTLRFWRSDEDFPARLQFLADRSLPRFMHYETAMFAASHLTDRLTALMQ